jgi:MFS family permease
MSVPSGRLNSPMWLVAYAFAVVMVGTTLPTPLYPRYEQRFGFSSLTVTVIFAVYAFGVIAALLFLGGLSDQIGRRPALLAGLALSAASAVAFLLAGGLGALLAGRVLSGLSAGIFTGTGTATLVDLAPPGRRAFATGVATAVNLGGLGCGPLLAGALAAVAAAPLRLPFWVDLGLLAPAFAAVIRTPETVHPSGRGLPRVQRLRVPAQLRGTFTRAATAGFASFAMSGLFGVVAPIFLATLLHLPSPALSGVTVFLLFTSSAVGQLAITRIPARAGLSAGCTGVIAGAGLVAAALALESLALLIIGAIVVGVGQGLSVGAGLDAINAEAPPDRRAEVASSFFVVLYVALSIPIIGTGLASQVIGLRASALIFTGFVAALAAACLVSLLARRPGDGAQQP